MSMRIHTAMADAVAVEYMTARELEGYDSELDDLPGSGLVIEDGGNCEAMVLCGDRSDILQLAKRITATVRPNPPEIDPEDFVAVEPADRVNYWDVVLYGADDGKPVYVNSYRRSGAGVRIMTDHDKLENLAADIAQYLGIDPTSITVDHRNNQLCLRAVDVMVLLANARKADVQLDERDLQ